MLLCWDISEKEADLFQEAIRSGLSDASVRSRELARLSYLNFRELFPRKAEKLKNELQNLGLKTRLEKEEEIHDQEKASMNYLQEVNGHSTSEKPVKKTSNVKSQTHTTPDSNETEDVDAILLESAAIVPQNAHLLRRKTHNDDAISSIQALIRGNLVRRQSSRYAFVDSYDDVTPKNPSNHGNEQSQHSNHLILSPLGEEDRRLSSLSDTSQPNSPNKLPNSSSALNRYNHCLNLSKFLVFSPEHVTAPRSSSRIEDNHDISPSHIKIGMVAIIIGKDPEVRGTIQYVGQTTFASGYWVGLKLDTPTGKNDGSIQGTQYFECPPMHGLFVRPGQLRIIEDPSQNEDDSDENEGGRKIEKTEGWGEAASDGFFRTNADTLRETLNTAYALKVKLAKSMSLLNRQLETIELFEGRVESLPGVVDDDCVEFVTTILELLQEEDKLIEEFRAYLPDVSK